VPEIPEILKKFHDMFVSGDKIFTLIGTAKNVDATKRVCDFEPIGDEADRFNVRLQSVISETLGLVLIPKENSTIGISFLNSTMAFVSLTSKLEKILIDTDLVQFNGGDNDGLVNIKDLITKLNNLETDMNTLKAAFSAWVVAPTDGGLALKAITATWFADTLTPTIQTELEDTKVTH